MTPKGEDSVCTIYLLVCRRTEGFDVIVEKFDKGARLFVAIQPMTQKLVGMAVIVLKNGLASCDRRV